MSDSFDAHDVLRDLPELLAGPEPVLETVQARARIAADPSLRAAILMAGSVAVAMRRGVALLDVEPKDVPQRLRKGAEVAARSMERGLVGVVYSIGMSALDIELRSRGEAIAIVDGHRAELGSAERSRASVISALFEQAGCAVPHSLLASLESAGPRRPASTTESAMRICLHLIPDLEAPGHALRLADSARVDQVTDWLRASRRCKTRFHIGASLLEVGRIHGTSGRFSEATDTHLDARAFLGVNLALAASGLAHAAAAGRRRDVDLWAGDVQRLLADPEAERGLLWHIEANLPRWSDAVRVHPRLVRAIGRVMPAAVASAMEGHA